MIAIKRIMRYLKGNKEYGLYYKKNENFELIAYIYVDWFGSLDDKKVLVKEHSFWQTD